MIALVAVTLCSILLSRPVTSDDIFLEVYKRHSITAKTKYSAYNKGKTETICIMTRDDICLNTNVYYPDTSIIGPYSAVYQNTPYGKSSIDGEHTEWNKMNFVYLSQDVRGRYDSNGSYSLFTKVGNDSLDTINWIISQSWSDGNVAVYGISANSLGQYFDPIGYTQYVWRDSNDTNDFTKYNEIYKHIRIMQLSLGTVMGYHELYQGGAYREGLSNGYLSVLNESWYIDVLINNEIFNPYWYTQSGPYFNQWDYFQQPIIHFVGWYDVFSTTQILTAIHLNESSINRNAKSQQILFIEPGGHCVNGEIIWPNSSYAVHINGQFRSNAFAAIFNASNNGQLNQFDIHNYYPFNVLYYQLGPGTVDSNGNFWVAAESFPPIQTKLFYLGHNNKSSNGTLQIYTNDIINGNDSYFYNPFDPVRTWGGNNLIVEPCGPWNQNHNEYGRTDILHFSSDLLTEDIYLVGMISVNLYVSSTAVDTDFTAKLIDIFPEKYGSKNMLVQDGIYRMRWRNAAQIDPFNGFVNQTAPPMESNKVYNITVIIGYMSYTFNKGHKISLSISSSNYKRFSINYNSGNLVVAGNKSAINATNYIYYGLDYPSALSLPVVNDFQWLQRRKLTL